MKVQAHGTFSFPDCTRTYLVKLSRIETGMTMGQQEIDVCYVETIQIVPSIIPSTINNAIF